MLKTLLKPAIPLMHQLSFKFKVILVFSLVSILLSLPTFVLFALHESVTPNGFTFFVLIVSFTVLLLIGSYFILALYYALIENFEQLEFGLNAIAHGETSVHLPSVTEDEIGRTFSAFNRMSYELTDSFLFLNRYKIAIDKSSIVSTVDMHGTITYVNQKFCNVSGYREEELVGQFYSMLSHPDTYVDNYEEMWRVLKHKEVWHGILHNRKKSGERYIVDVTMIPIIDHNNRAMEYVVIWSDSTELHKSREELEKHRVDYLTGLPNANKFTSELQRITHPIIFYFNIDKFMSLNDFYGNRVGDQVLVDMAEILSDIAERYQSQAYRLYNDEFLLLCAEGSINTGNSKPIMRDMLNEIEASTMKCIAPASISFTVSGGVSSYLLDENYENLPVYARTARHIATQQGKKFLVYTHEMRNEEDYAKNINWIRKIKSAIKDDRFLPYFQPIMNNKTGEIVKYEALIRMHDELGETVTPFFFLEVAKRAKLYSKITHIVIQKTFEEFCKHPDLKCSINLSTEDIINKETRSYICSALGEYPHPENIIFEITESEEIKDFDVVNRFIQKVRMYGVQISIDDFGTGYANFDYILNLDIDYIKIDGSLIRNLDTDVDSRIITEAIILFSKKLGTQTIVEYVHNQEIFDEVVGLGADYSQGYFIGEPKASIS